MRAGAGWTAGGAIAGVIGAALAVAAIAAGSATPVGLASVDGARVRVSWTARPERIETCRALSDEELAQRPEHMRQRMECEGGFATYALDVAVDGRRLGESVVKGGGVRNDRPIHYLQEFEVEPGEREVQLTLVRREANAARSEEDGHDDDDDDDRGISAVRTEREREERRRRERTALPAKVELDTTLSLRGGQVAVITFDPVRQAFVVVR
jgi:hypothetical protein